MGWTSGRLDGPFSARSVIALDLGLEMSDRVLDTAVRGSVIYAAVRSAEGARVFALVLLVENEDGLIHTKSVLEEAGPAPDDCPRRILSLLSEPLNDLAHDWRRRCYARLGSPDASGK